MDLASTGAGRLLALTRCIGAGPLPRQLLALTRCIGVSPLPRQVIEHVLTLALEGRSIRRDHSGWELLPISHHHLLLHLLHVLHLRIATYAALTVHAVCALTVHADTGRTLVGGVRPILHHTTT